MTITVKNRIDDIPSRAKTKSVYDHYRPQYERAQAKISKKIRQLLIAEGLNATFKIRAKTFDSYFNKVLRLFNENRDPLVIQDLIGKPVSHESIPVQQHRRRGEVPDTPELRFSPIRSLKYRSEPLWNTFFIHHYRQKLRIGISTRIRMA